MHLVKHVGGIILGLEGLQSAQILAVDVVHHRVASYIISRQSPFVGEKTYARHS
jgi:hypothetical protein